MQSCCRKSLGEVEYFRQGIKTHEKKGREKARWVKKEKQCACFTSFVQTTALRWRCRQNGQVCVAVRQNRTVWNNSTGCSSTEPDGKGANRVCGAERGWLDRCPWRDPQHLFGRPKPASFGGFQRRPPRILPWVQNSHVSCGSAVILHQAPWSQGDHFGELSKERPVWNSAWSLHWESAAQHA